MKRSLADSLSARGRTGFVPFVVAGDPSLRATERLVLELGRAGADIVELGVPFSDPVADGPVIQAASERALKTQTSLRGVLALAKRLRASGAPPLILFTYLNPVLRLGLPRFAAEAAAAGLAGVLCVDLPAEEGGELSRELRRRGLEPVLLAAPTTSDARLKAIGRASGSIVYYVSREGVTGVRRGLAPGVAERIEKVRRLTGKAVIVGFGVSEPGQVKALARYADGVVVGSALVERAADRGLAAAARLTRRLIAAL